MPGLFISTEKKFNLSDDQTKTRLFSAKLGVNSSSVRREAASVKVKQEKIKKNMNIFGPKSVWKSRL
jgi:hypothetical protein